MLRINGKLLSQQDNLACYENKLFSGYAYHAHDDLYHVAKYENGINVPFSEKDLPWQSGDYHRLDDLHRGESYDSPYEDRIYYEEEPFSGVVFDSVKDICLQEFVIEQSEIVEFREWNMHGALRKRPTNYIYH